jgi:hypothetical protein
MLRDGLPGYVTQALSQTPSAKQQPHPDDSELPEVVAVIKA